MGVELSTGSSKTGTAQVDATVAAVVLDGEGKIVSCRIDCAQSKMDVADGAVDAAKTFKTKMELGDEYGMVAYGNAIAEWDAQTKAFEEFVVGKTAAEVEALETVLKNNHNVAVDETLYASCTMDITAFKAAVVKACGEVNSVSFTAAEGFTLGVAAITNAADSTAATAEEDGVVKMYTEFGAAVVDAEGKILAAVTDATQPKISVSTAGQRSFPPTTRAPRWSWAPTTAWLPWQRHCGVGCAGQGLLPPTPSGMTGRRCPRYRDHREQRPQHHRR